MKAAMQWMMAVVCVLGTAWAGVSYGAAAEGEYVLQANIWYERMDRVYSTNYHVGQMLPVGTKVTVTSTSRNRIVFKSEDGDVFTIHFNAKHSSIGFDGYFDRYFGETSPLDGDAFSKKQEEQIKSGRVEIGMSKAAVLASYGYPPSHRTPSTDAESWIYWINRFRSIAITFTDGKVSAFPNGRP